jgi:DNA modification methylase
VNQLFYGDNLTIMQYHMKKYSVDLIYLDPPFNSKQNYNLMYKTMTGKPVPEQAEAFCDTWEMDAQKEKIARNMPSLMQAHGIDTYYVEFWKLWMNALRNTQPHLLAYLIYMVERLLHMKSILRPTGSIYLHCDPTASHYIKIMMDGIFGHQNFRNEIIWKRTSAHNSARRWGPVHDVILFYSKSEKYLWNKVYQEYDDSYIENFYRHTDIDGRRYRIGDLTGAGVRNGASGETWRNENPTNKGRHWAPPRRFPDSHLVPKGTIAALDYLDSIGRIHWPEKGGVPGFKRFLDDMNGVQIQDIIDDITPISSHGKERLGYPTQKPVALLERIISASTNKGDVVFDPFCGCGTTIYAAQKLEREWIGCDIAILAIKLIKEVLSEKYRLAEGAHFKIDGVPVSVEQAETLFKSDPFQFQHWVVERVGGFPMQKKVADRGIDGRLYFETGKNLWEMVLSVKGGNVKPSDIRDLRGVLEREESAKLAGFLSMKTPTKAMRDEAESAGIYEYNGVSYQRIQFLTVGDILENHREFHTPTKIGSKISTGQGILAL